MYTNLAYVIPTYSRVKKLQVLVINKDAGKSLSRKKGNNNPIWSWNDSYEKLNKYRNIEIYRQEKQMSDSVVTVDGIKDDNGITNKPDQGEEFKEKNTGNRRGNQSRRIMELVQLHTANRYFKGDTPELGVVLGLLSQKLDIGKAFHKFRENQKVM